MKKYSYLLLLPLLISTVFAVSSIAQHTTPQWTHFRGSNLNGISNETGLPLTWSDTNHIEWKTSIDGKGWSSPVVYGDQVWLTTEVNRGMRAICINFYTGEIIHDRTIFHPDTLFRKHSVNTYATPTPALEDNYVYIHFGRYGTACLSSRNGEIVWKRTDLQCEHVQGPGSSLMLYKDQLIVHTEGTDVQYITALDKRTGNTLWRTDRPRMYMMP